MLQWIEAQPTALVVLIVLVGVVVANAALLVVSAALSRCRISAELKAVSPVTLTPLSVLVGLLIAFLASHVWANIDRARGAVAEEAYALRQAVLLVEFLPSPVRGAVREAVRHHVEIAVKSEWPAMARGDASLRELPVALTAAMTAVLSIAPTASDQSLAQQRALVALERALEARRHRIALSETTIEPLQWIVILVLAGLILVTIAEVHIDRPVARISASAVFSVAIGTCLVLLLVNDQPFVGVGAVTPATLIEIVPD